MIENINDRHLQDRYLQGELSGVELDDFNRRLTDDEVFKREVELKQLIYSGINLAKEQQLQQKILSTISYRKNRVPYALKLIIVFLVITFSGITLWFYIGNENKVTTESWRVTSDAWRRARSVFTGRPSPAPHRAQPAVEEPRKVSDTLQSTSDQEPMQESLSENKDTANTLEGEDIVVKQDKMLITVNLSVKDKSGDGKSEPDRSLTADAVQKLNPSADLPSGDENKITSYEVEFWVSPINYRGYKMSKNKLLLFGIEEPDGVKLYRLNDAIYMSYFKDIYRLNNTLDFMPYQKLKEPEIPSALR